MRSAESKASWTSLVVSTVLLTLVALCIAWPAAAQTTNTLRIGLIASVTGPMAPGFKSMVEAAKPAAEFMNQRGGITVNGQKYKIEVVTEDDQSTPSGAVGAANKLMQTGIKIMMPPMFMPSNMAIAPMCEGAKILRIKALGAGKEEVNPSLKYSFYITTGVHGIPAGYDYLKKSYPKAKKIAIVTPDDPGGKTYRELIQKEVPARGLEIVFHEAFNPGSEDFYPILTKALAAKPDAIDMIFGIEPWTAGILNQSRELGFTGPVFASWLYGDVNRVAGMLTPKYAYDTFEVGPDVLSPKMPPMLKEYRAALERQSKGVMDMNQAIPLDALYVIQQAIEKAQSFDTTKIATTLEGMTSIDTVYGKGRVAGQDFFGTNHVVRRAFPVSRIMNGKVECEFSRTD